MPITDWPAQERPREKLLANGAHHLSEAELLAIFLRTGTKGYTAVDLARQLLKDFGGLRNLLSATQHEFCHRPGLGLAKYAQLQAIMEMSRRYLQQSLQKADVLTSSIDTKLYFTSCLRHQARETFACLFLDARYQVIRYEEIFHGTLDSAEVYPREVVKRALYHNAAAVILAHNHPSGLADPSQADEDLTQQLVLALQLIAVRVLDHVIVGEGEVTSFAELGLL
jgi:DNA repair protein RadC